MLLQMGFVTIFIYSLPLIAPVKKLPREITFLLPRLRQAPERNPVPRGRAPSAAVPALNAPQLALPPVGIPPVEMPPTASELQAFGSALFGCAPENLGKLTQEQRTHCPGLITPPDPGVMAEPPSLVEDLPRRQAELTARNTPARVPCTHLETQKLGFGGSEQTSVFADPLCLLRGWINGFGGLPP